MAKSIFGITASNPFLPRENIALIAQRTIKLFRKLGSADPIFFSPYFIGKNDNDKYSLDITSKDSESILADLILRFAEGSINDYEKVSNPTIEFSRGFGFVNLYDFYHNGKHCFSVSTNFGSSSGGGASIKHFNKEKDFSFNWYNLIFKALVEETEELSGIVSISNKSFIDLVTPLQIRFPLGWITYFSNDYEIQIPNDLEGIEYEFTEKGKYLILTREDFTINKEAYEAHKQKLLKVMEEIKHRVPEYGK